MGAQRSGMLTAAWTAIVLVLAPAATAQAAGIGPDTLTYTEEIAAGPRRFDGGRELPRTTNTFGIDIDSRVRIDIDEEKLRAENDGACLETNERADLNQRLEKLKAAAESLEDAAAATLEAVEAFAAAGPGDDGFGDFMSEADRMAKLLMPLLEALEPAPEPYLKRQGVPARELRKKADELQDSLLNGRAGYNWPLIRQVLYSEIEAVAARLEQLDRSLEIQAHLIQAAGATALALDGYNQVATGPERLHPRLRFGGELADEAQQTGKAIEKAKEKGEEAEEGVAAERGTLTAALEAKAAPTATKVQTAATEAEKAKARAEGKKVEDAKARLATAAEVAKTAAGMPLPAGLQRRPFHATLDTSFNLKDVSEVRPQPADRVKVRSRIFCGEEPLAGADRTDSFTVRAFGWTDAAFPIVAFTQLDKTRNWEADGGFTWLLRRNPWPREGQTDRPPRQLRWWGGLGISALELDFDEEETLEIGFALTTAFIQDRLVAGYGIDLQKDEDRQFWFFSIRVFPKFSLLEKAKRGGE